MSAMVITSESATRSWICSVISPGWRIAFFISKGQPCGGLGDCLIQALNAAGRTMEIASGVNFIYYGLLVFGIATLGSALREKWGWPDRSPTTQSSK